jgi:hypothetical protein
MTIGNDRYLVVDRSCHVVWRQQTWESSMATDDIAVPPTTNQLTPEWMASALRNGGTIEADGEAAETSVGRSVLRVRRHEGGSDEHGADRGRHAAGFSVASRRCAVNRPVAQTVGCGQEVRSAYRPPSGDSSRNVRYPGLAWTTGSIEFTHRAAVMTRASDQLAPVPPGSPKGNSPLKGG